MSYEKQNFVEGQILTAEMLNHMEEGIRDLAEESGDSLRIGTVTGGTTASATIENGRLNLVLPKGDPGAAGAQGPKGDKGDTGPKGADGAQGQTGATPNLTIGTVTTGTDAAATITGTAEAPVLNLTLPKGEKGDKGDPGSSGSSTGGGTTDLTIGTVTSGTTASATIENGKLNLVLPKGDTGAKGDAGPKGDVGDKGETGPAGPAGEGFT